MDAATTSEPTGPCLEQQAPALPESGPIRLFLDDDRDAPKGWVLLRTTGEFIAALNACDSDRLDAISFDWHLGRYVPNANGALDALLERMRSTPSRFQKLDRLHFHSSDHGEALAMLRCACDVITDRSLGLPFIMVDLSLPWDEED